MRSRLLTALFVLASAGPLGAQTWAGAPARAAFGSTVVLSDADLFVGRSGEVAFFPAPSRHVGVVHAYARDASGRWVQGDTLVASGSQIGDGFASALAADGNVLVVGAPKTADARGAAYVFERAAPGGPWREAARLEGASPATGDRFCHAVAVTGDQVLVSAPGRDGNRGAVAVFRRQGTGWARAADLTGEGTAAGDLFGVSLAAGDGVVAVGAPGPLPFSSLFGAAPPRPGALYVFRSGAEGWTQAARLAPAAADGAVGLGASVAVDGDAVYAAAPLADRGAGRVVRYAVSGANGWSEAGRLAPGSASPGFGLALDVSGGTALVGAPVTGNGAAYLFPGGAAAPARTFAGNAPFGYYGSSVAVEGDVAVVGGPGTDLFEGVAFVYARQPDGTWREAERLVAPVRTLAAITGEMRECDAAQAAVEGFGCAEVDLMAFLPLDAIGGGRGVVVNDIWGWTDAESGREYALVGRSDGLAFVDVTAPSSPRYLGDLPLHDGATPNVWRDVKVYRDHAFIVSDGAGAHGVQVFDLTRLRSVAQPPQRFTEDAHYDRIASAHNIVVNESTGFAYVVGASMGGDTCGGGLHMLDVRDPKNPTFAGCFADPQTGNAGTGYSHDAQCVTYRGPDGDYQGREICFGANETMLSIADVTDKSAPVAVARIAYPSSAYLHQGWVSDDHRYLYMNDEGDEVAGLVPRTRTLVWDIADLDDPVLATEYLGETAASDHNLYVRGNYVFESNYVGGLRILDISDPENPVEVGHFDTVPWGQDVPGFAGSWSNYPFFESGNVVVTSMWEGLFVVRFRRMGRPVS